MTDTTNSPDHVLYIAGVAMSQSQRSTLRAIGVDVASITSEEVEAGLRDEGSRPALRDRIASARYCVLGPGAGIRVVTAVLRQREDASARTWVSSVEGRGVAEGMALGGVGAEYGLHVSVTEEELFRELRRLGETHAVAAPLLGPVVRPPLPVPFLCDPSAYTSELTGSEWDHDSERFRQGYFTSRELIEGNLDVPSEKEEAEELLLYLIRHTPSDELHLLSAPRVGLWWEAARSCAGRHPLATLLATALARDAGQATLAALPETMQQMRAGIEAAWPGAVQRARSNLMLECVSASDCHDALLEPINNVARFWPMVPCEDPLAPEVDVGLFRPTLTTFRVARRYRSAPEVLREAYARWGGRPYQQRHAHEQLGRFVTESCPTSAEEVEGWARLLAGLREGRFRHCITAAIRWGWPRIEIPIANTLEVGKLPIERVPYVDANGRIRADLLEQVLNHGTRRAMQNRADLAASGGRHRTSTSSVSGGIHRPVVAERRNHQSPRCPRGDGGYGIR